MTIHSLYSLKTNFYLTHQRSASFSVDMAIGAADGITDEEKVGAVYCYQMDLTTSFTWEDSLNISFDTGFGGHLSELYLNATTWGALVVDSIFYTFTVGDKKWSSSVTTRMAARFIVLHICIMSQQIIYTILGVPTQP